MVVTNTLFKFPCIHLSYFPENQNSVNTCSSVQFIYRLNEKNSCKLQEALNALEFCFLELSLRLRNHEQDFQKWVPKLRHLSKWPDFQSSDQSLLLFHITGFFFSSFYSLQWELQLFGTSENQATYLCAYMWSWKLNSRHPFLKI